MASVVVSCIQKHRLFIVIRTGLVMAEPKESHQCGSAAWSIQDEAMGMSSLVFLLGVSRC